MKKINKAFHQANRTESGDECYTPTYAVMPLLEFITKEKHIWLPFDKPWSSFNQVFSENGYTVTISHISEGKDFFKYSPECDIIVSNPPFSKKDKVLERLYSINKPFAMLLPVASLQSKRRFEQFKKGLELLVFDSRVQYYTKNFEIPTGNCYFGSAYFCHGILPEKLVFRKLNPCYKLLNQSI